MNELQLALDLFEACLLAMFAGSILWLIGKGLE
jgi:hypothetical protein